MSQDWGGPHVCTLADQIAREYGVSFDEAARDAEFRQLYEESCSLCADAASYAQRLRSIGEARLRDGRFVTELQRSFARLRDHLVAGTQPPHLIAEALQIAVGDLQMIEEMADYGAPRDVIDELCQDLVAGALFTGNRLVLNLGRRLRATRPGASPPELDEAKIRPLGSVVELEQPEVLGRGEIPRTEPVLVVATAGRGTRLHTTIPKALIPLTGGSFLSSILAASRRAGVERVIAVVKHRASMHPRVLGPDILYVVQKEALGTGHSFASALKLLQRHEGPCLLSYSDTPFLTATSFRNVLEPVIAGRAGMTVLAVATEEWPEFGRLEESDGRVRAVLQPRFGERGGERADGGLYAGWPGEMLPALLATRNRNHRYEYSFTEICAELDRRGQTVAGISTADSREALGVNQPADLIAARRLVCELRAGLEFFRSFGGDPGEGLAPSEMLERVNSYSQSARTLLGPVFVLDDRKPGELAQH